MPLHAPDHFTVKTTNVEATARFYGDVSACRGV